MFHFIFFINFAPSPNDDDDEIDDDDDDENDAKSLSATQRTL